MRAVGLRWRTGIVGLLVGTWLAGCAGPAARRPVALDDAEARCAARLAAIDDAVTAGGVRDAAAVAIAGRPELRATRFLCALGKLARSPEQQRQWLDLLKGEAQARREREIANLPEAALRSLVSAQPHAARSALLEEAERCSSALLASDQVAAGAFAAVLASCEVPDDYSLGLRTAGLYPITAPVVLAVSRSDQEKSRRWFTESDSRLPRQGLPVRLVPTAGGALGREEAGAIVAASRANPLRVPLPDTGRLARLAAAYAPVIEQDVGGRQDRPGRVEWHGLRLKVDPDVPLAYHYPSWALHGDEILLQLNYAFWYAARMGPLVPQGESGALDGLVVRITLGGDGLPLVADFMLACGCYHGYAPVRGRVGDPRPLPLTLDPFAPVWLADEFLPGRLTLEVLSGWHRVEGARVSGGESPAETVSYRLEDYVALESLPVPDGGRASAFDPAGLMKGTERPERKLLFPMGIPSVGSLRQRGRQPTRLVGREHFDDPRLLERDFELP